MKSNPSLALDSLLDSGSGEIYNIAIDSPRPAGKLPLTDDMLHNWPGGVLFDISRDMGGAASGQRRHLERLRL